MTRASHTDGIQATKVAFTGWPIDLLAQLLQRMAQVDDVLASSWRNRSESAVWEVSRSATILQGLEL